MAASPLSFLTSREWPIQSLSRILVLPSPIESSESGWKEYPILLGHSYKWSFCHLQNRSPISCPFRSLNLAFIPIISMLLFNITSNLILLNQRDTSPIAAYSNWYSQFLFLAFILSLCFEDMCISSLYIFECFFSVPRLALAPLFIL